MTMKLEHNLKLFVLCLSVLSCLVNATKGSCTSTHDMMIHTVTQGIQSSTVYCLGRLRAQGKKSTCISGPIRCYSYYIIR